jgi:branched-chain amino acid transport system permease protein
VYLSTVGIIGRFDERNVVTGVIRLGRTLLLLVVLLAGYVAAQRVRRAGESGAGRLAAAGAVTGAVTGAVVAALLLLTDSVNLSSMFINLNARLVETLSFGLSPISGALLLVAAGALLGSVGAGLMLLRPDLRKPLVTGLVSVLGISLAEPLLEPILSGLNFPTNWLYESGGLSVSGAVLVFLIAAGITVLRAQRGEAIRQRYTALPPRQRTVLRGGAALALIAFLALLPIIVGSFVSDVLGNVGLYVLLGLGLNIVVGYAGLLDLGYVAFFAVGAYAMAILTSTESFLVTDEATRFAEQGFTNFWVALPITVILAIIIGVLIGAPVLRLRGDYLAIVTLGFGEIVRTLVLSDWLAPWLGGAQGIIQIPAAPPEALDLRDPERLYYVVLAFGILAAYVCARLVGSRVGRAWAAMREDESVAEAMGISVIKYKLLAFAMGAAVGCLGGAFFAIKLGSVFPSSFELLVSINVLAVLVLGGMGSIRGVVVGSFVLVGLPDLLREFAEFRLLIFGVVLVAIMILRPEGLLPNVRRQRELHAEVADEDQAARGGPGAAPILATGTAGSPEEGS